tara:strand:- start:6609 stop:6773 length:165 start_codon:yes stop_codon:yes gene_type:complete
MKLKEVEKVRKRAAQSLCTYEISGAYVRIRATELLAVCDELLKQMKSQQLTLEL